MKTKILIALAIVLVVIIGGIVSLSAVANSPSNVALRSIANFSEDIAERSDIEPIISTLSGGSVQFSLDSITEDGENYFEDSSVSGKIYLSTDALMLTDFNASFYGNKLAGSAYMSQERIYINETEILEGTYGAKVSSLTEELSNSIFAPDSGSDYSLDEDVYEELISALENIDKNSELERDMTKLLEVLFKDLWEIVIENSEILSEKADIRLSGEKTAVRLITISIGHEAAENIIADIYNYLCQSDDIVDFIEKYEDTLVFAFDEVYDEDEDNSLAEAYEEWLEDIEDDVEDLCDNIDDYFDTLQVTIATPKSSKTLLKLEVTVDKETVFSLDCGSKGIKKSDKIDLEITDVKSSYRVNKNDRKSLDISFTVNYHDEKYEFSLVIDKERDEYTASYKVTDEGYDYYIGGNYWGNSYSDSYTYTDKYTVKGTIVTKGDTTTLTIDKIINKYGTDYEYYDSYDSEYEDVFKLDCKLIIDTNTKMPSLIKKYNTLSDITEDDIEDWIDQLEEFYDNI